MELPLENPRSYAIHTVASPHIRPHLDPEVDVRIEADTWVAARLSSWACVSLFQRLFAHTGPEYENCERTRQAADRSVIRQRYRHLSRVGAHQGQVLHLLTAPGGGIRVLPGSGSLSCDDGVSRFPAV